MRGEMLWFNAAKGFGFIRTEHDERLHVPESGFVPGHVPTGRCAGLEVTFDREEGDAGPQAANVSFPPPVDAARARLRHQRTGTAL